MAALAPLGSSGIEITRVGFGAWALGGGGWQHGWGDQDDAESVGAIHAAVEGGVNWIDTAPVYGLGHSEEVVGRALRELPENDRPYVFTKCGLTFDREHPKRGPCNVMSRASVRAELQSSLRRLGLERIDLYQVHWPPEDGTPLEHYWETMAELRSEGLVRAIGLSNHDASQVRAAERIGHVDALQPPFSMIHRGAAELIAAAREQETGVIVYSPMQSGLLSGSMSAERVASMPEDDWRQGDEDFTGEKLRRNLQLAEALRPVAHRLGVPVAAVAVAWTLRWRGVTGAIVGARSAKQVAAWLPAAELVLGDCDLAAISRAIRESGAGGGPVEPTDLR